MQESMPETAFGFEDEEVVDLDLTNGWWFESAKTAQIDLLGIIPESLH